MKKILITGQKSKLGTAFQEYIGRRYRDCGYDITALSLRGDDWLNCDFREFDVIYHCAGVYKVPGNEYRYYDEINVKLTEKLCRKAIAEGVGQFIYLSTMDVYAGSPAKEISEATEAIPTTPYGRSKYEAEKILGQLTADSTMKLAVIRCCPVVGKNAESTLEGYRKAFRFPVFPLMFYDNKRSLLHVDTLCELVRLIMDHAAEGVFLPQNLPSLSVAEILETLKKCNSYRTLLVKVPKFLWFDTSLTRRIFGPSCYSESVSGYFDGKYQLYSSYEVIESLK